MAYTVQLFGVLLGLLAVCVRSQTPLPRPKGCVNETASEQDVADRYFKRFGNWQRPRLNSSQPVDVNITLVLSSINDVLEKERIIKITAYISVRWMDEFRVWMNDFPYNCVDYVVLPATDVWLPDIAQMNAEGRYTLMSMVGEKVRIYSNGYTIYSPGGTFMAFCDYDLTLFPFDTQNCTIKLESWRYTAIFMRFNFGNNVTLKQWSENEQWELIGTSQAKIGLTYLDPGNSFDHIQFYLVIRRKVVYYLMNIIIPSSIISLAQLATFTLPVDEVMKIHISFTCLLAYSVFQLMIVDDMPRSSDHVPLLSIYIDLQMAYISLSMIFEGIVFVALRKADSGHRHPPELPNFIYAIVAFLGKVFMVGDPPRPPPPPPMISHLPPPPPMGFNIPLKTAANGNGEQKRKDTLRRLSIMDAIDENEVETSFPERFRNGSLTEQIGPPVVVGRRYSVFNGGGGGAAPIQLAAAIDQNSGYTHQYHFAAYRQQKWRYMADVIDRMVFVFYLSCLILTPLGMFAIHPALQRAFT